MTRAARTTALTLALLAGWAAVVTLPQLFFHLIGI